MHRGNIKGMLYKGNNMLTSLNTSALQKTMSRDSSHRVGGKYLQKTSDKRLLLEIYNELLKLNNLKTIQLKYEPKILPKEIYRWQRSTQKTQLIIRHHENAIQNNEIPLQTI